ncbi:MAG TPA: carboxypeptidase regulatory-like domain-containing protein [Acidobacteriaceae bacterium]
MTKVRARFTCFLLIIGLAAFAHAQVSKGTITGRVTDPSGAVITGANVVATEVSTGSKYTAVTNGAGDYSFPFVAPGTYRVMVTRSGFKAFVRENVVVGANEHVGVDVPLEMGEQSQTVTISAESSLLETTTASIGQVLNTEDAANMPVNGNTPLILAQLAMGVIPANNPQFFHPFDNSGPSGFTMGGAAQKKNELLMDGSPDYLFDGTIAFSPPMDAVQEVKVDAFQADAAYGHTAGGTVNQVTKSGTNKYHGSLYEFGQWSALNDTPWFTKVVAAKKSVTRSNQFGGSYGGPVVIPRLYDGHDKLFIFGAFEEFLDNTPSPSLTTVPTDAERKGDFSALLPAVTIYDPYTAVLASGKITRQPISYLGRANVIPPSYLNTVGTNLLNYYAEPNTTGLANGQNNFYYPGNSTDRFDSELVRIDVSISSKNKLFYDFRHNDRFHASGNVFGNLATGSYLIQPNWGSTLDDVHVFSGRTVWDNRVNWTRNITSRPLASSIPLTSLGFPAALQSSSRYPAFPVTSMPFFVSYGYSKGQYEPFDGFQIFTMLSHIIGRHSLEVGADGRLEKTWSLADGNSAGSYTFGGTGWTNGPLSTAGGAFGQDLAALEMGLPTSGSYDLNTNETSSARFLAVFVQDNFRLLPSLTLNLGLRYEHDFPSVESNNRAVNGFASTQVSPINTAAQAAFTAHPVSGITFPTLMGGLVFATPSNRNFYQTKADNFSPRIGFAWTPLPQTSIRGGMGIFNDNVGRQDAIAPGYNQTTVMQVTTNSFLSPSTTLSNPFPGGLTQPPGNSLGLSTFLGQSVSYYAPEVRNDYAIRWDLDIQRNLPGNTLVEIGYVGTHIARLPVSKSLNYVPASYLNVGQARVASVVNFLSAPVSNPFAGLLPGTNINGSTVAQSQLLLPYPQFTGVTLSSDPIGSSVYDMLEMRVEKRMSHGVRFLANYALSKKLDRTSYLNPQDAALEKRISPDDRPHHLVISGTWELPFGQKRKFNPEIPVATYLISGWNLTEIYTLQPDGPPFAWGDVIYNGGSLNNLRVNPHNVSGTFDISQFDKATANQPVTGDHIRTLPTQVTHARADGINSLDLSISKSNRITERLNAQLRCDMFNSLNHPQFAAPNLTPTSGTFGTISSQANLPRQVQVSLKLTF